MPPRYPRVGRRGIALLVLASLWIYIGVLPVLAAESPPVPGVPHTYLPTWVRAAIWIVPALVALAHVGRYRDIIGWVALVLPPAERAVSYLYGWTLHALPGGADGYPTGILSAGLYVHMVAIIIVLVGWREPVPLPRESEGDEHDDHTTAGDLS